MLREMERHYGAPEEGRVIYNGRDPRYFHPGHKEDFVLTAGRLWDEAKNVAALERIAPRLPWRVYVAGERRHPEGGCAGLSNVEPLGCLTSEEMSDWMARAAIYALPAKYEPFGLSVLEAALSGCALVLGDIPTLRELWEGAALFVPPGDDKRLVEAIRGIAVDDARRREFGALARRRALEFTPERMAAGYMALYSQLAEWRALPVQEGAQAYTAI
jgi:glycosyltransferase involved in cell wall biosynthesis